MATLLSRLNQKPERPQAQADPVPTPANPVLPKPAAVDEITLFDIFKGQLVQEKTLTAISEKMDREIQLLEYILKAVNLLTQITQSIDHKTR